MNDEIRSLLNEGTGLAEEMLGEAWVFEGQPYRAIVAEGQAALAMAMAGYVASQDFTLRATLAQFNGSLPALIEKKSKIVYRGMTLLVDTVSNDGMHLIITASKK